jgi:phage terminase large subunit-like protein
MTTLIPAASQQSALAAKDALLKNLPHLYGWKWYRWAKTFFESKNKKNLICAANQLSKALPLDTEIPTPAGWVRVKDLKVGDRLFSASGEQQKVIDIPFDGTDEMYEIFFDDDTSVVASKHHVWWVKGYTQRFKKKDTEYGRWVRRTTAEIMSEGGYGPGTSAPKRFVLPICRPVDYAEKPDLPDPYFMGLFIGDGCATGRIITNPEPEIGAYLVSKGATVRKFDGKCPAYGIGVFYGVLRYYALDKARSHEKFIPEDYLRAGIEQRKELLYGLMDTDGCAARCGTYSYTTTSPRLAADFKELVASLGGKTRSAWRKTSYVKDGKRVPCKDACTIHVLLPFCPFRLPRKAARWYPIRYRHERVIWEIRPLGKRRCRCITVSSRTGSFLATRGYHVTHNSSTQIRKCIHWATDQRLWPELWPNCTPRIFWYLYPSRDVATTEFENKWVPEFLPRGPFKDDPIFGWEAVYDKRQISHILFKSGITLYFKAYSQGSDVLQTATVAAVFTDEELPETLLPEVLARLIATDGYFHMVFTATLNQDIWKRTIEGRGENEFWPDALKLQVSLYDCLTYADGSRSHWTEDRIERIIADCKDQNEVQRRVFGKFVTSEGRMYPAFDGVRHFMKPKPIPDSWRVFSAVDPGSGGAVGHPAAILFLAVSPDNRMGWFFKGWRGDGIVTVAGDVLEKYREIRPSRHITQEVYDWAAKDFGVIATRAGIGFHPANKNRETGIQIVNTLFRNDMLFVFDDSELRKLGSELTSLMQMQDKRHAKDDFADCARYSVMAVPWDFSGIKTIAEEEVDAQENEEEKPLSPEEYVRDQIRRRRGEWDRESRNEWDELADDIAEINENYGS